MIDINSKRHICTHRYRNKNIHLDIYIYIYIDIERAADMGVLTRIRSADRRTPGSARAWLKFVLELRSSGTSVGSNVGQKRQT